MKDRKHNTIFSHRLKVIKRKILMKKVSDNYLNLLLLLMWNNYAYFFAVYFLNTGFLQLKKKKKKIIT